MGKVRKAYRERERRSIKAEVIKLISEGHSLNSASDVLGVSNVTLYSWAKKDTLFQRAVDTAKEKGGRGLVESGLYKLARGADEVETTEQWVGKKVLMNGDEVPCTFSRKVKKKAPSEKALAMLAQRYAPEYVDNEDHNKLTIKITQKDRTLTIEERLNLLKLDKEDAIEITDFKDLGELSGSDLDQ